ncbi:acyl-CoA transferase [Martelella alba]|uniref:Acyl-CoA transferase n=1 Tax=Martelella alba TaxID=2590451 RepID=A0A506U126_9HYPH|nr:CoA transferase [Martelella alba]TPW27470.1 acyl-CoA transferase [Martelella alba]
MTGDAAEFFRDEIEKGLGPADAAQVAVCLTGDFQLSSVFHVSDLAAASMAGAMQAFGLLVGGRQITLDRRRAELWCGMTVKPDGWVLPEAWDPIAGNYRCRDGWVRLHTNAPAHRAAVLGVLGVEATHAAVEEAVAVWKADALAQAVVAAGGVAAAMIGLDDWAGHPQGRAVAAEPLIHWEQFDVADKVPLPAFSGSLAGLKVLDLTRVLAGPVATRFLAGFGASVLRIDPPDWNEEGLEAEVTLGKTCAGLDLKCIDDRRIFEDLLSEAHVLVHGYRPGALDRLGYDAVRRRVLNPGLIDVSLSAYGWTGPWRERRGFDSVLQVATGLAAEAMRMTGADRPVALPVQVLDHGTGYLMAAAVLRGLARKRANGRGCAARLSLARTAHLLASAGTRDPVARQPGDEVVAMQAEETHWGPARRVVFPASLDGRGPHFARPAGPFRASPALWPV